MINWKIKCIECERPIIITILALIAVYTMGIAIGFGLAKYMLFN